MKWWGIGRRFVTAPRSDDAQVELIEAYNNVFKAGSPDVQIVLADLANFTGFFRVNGQGIPPDDRAFSDGMRAAFGRLFRFTQLAEEEREALIQSTRVESRIDATYGDFT